MPTIVPIVSSPHSLKPSLSSPMAVVIDFHQPPPPYGSKPWKQRCRLRSFPHPDPNLLLLDPSTSLSPSSPSRHRPSIHRSLSTPCFSSYPVVSDLRQQQLPAPRVENIGSRRAKGTQALIVETAIALASGELPLPATSGLGAAYFLRNRSNECFALIKPIGDDDPPPLTVLARPSASRLAVHATETGVREVAAYILDHGGFSGVPPTALIKISHPALHSAAVSSPCSHVPRKVASIQRFVPHDFDAGDLGPSMFSVGSVHRIGILDIRLLNIDRHAGNILVRKLVLDNNESPSPMAELVPIDHGLCLPELLDDPYFEWLHWPQATVPFSEPESEYISALDPFKDAALLRAELPSLKEAAIRIMILCTVFLRKAAEEGLCLADIGSMMTRESYGLQEGPSMLEALCKRAEYVQSPSTASHANSHPSSESAILSPARTRDAASGFSLSRYSSSRGSNSSFPHEKKAIPDGVLKSGRLQILDEDAAGAGRDELWRLVALDPSASCGCIAFQMLWRLLVSILTALLVFFLLTKPPPPKVSFEIAGFKQFSLGEGLDSTGVVTKILSSNCSVDMVVDNNSNVFGLHVRPPSLEMAFGRLRLARSQGPESYVESRSTGVLRLSVAVTDRPVYGAGRSMQDMLESGKGLPLAIRVRSRSSYRVVWSLIKLSYLHHVDCLLVLNGENDEKQRLHIHNSTCST